MKQTLLESANPAVLVRQAAALPGVAHALALAAAAVRPPRPRALPAPGAWQCSRCGAGPVARP